MRLVQLTNDTIFRLTVWTRKVHQSCRLPFDYLNRVRMLIWVRWYLPTTLLPDIALQLLDPQLFALNTRLSLKQNLVVSIQLLLQLNDILISFVKSRCQSNHDVSLLEQQLLISVNLGLSFFDLSPLSLDFI